MLSIKSDLQATTLITLKTRVSRNAYTIKQVHSISIKTQRMKVMHVIILS